MRPGEREPLVVVPRAGKVPPAASVGGKAHNLARLAAAGAAVPPWIVVPVDTFRALLPAELTPPGTPEAAEAWRRRVREMPLPAELVEALRQGLEEAGLSGLLLAVRSSASAEDGAAASFAGQFDTRLGVRAEGVADALREVWASACNEHALRYGGGLVPMGVVVQAMVDAEAAGVAFGADPVSGRRDVVVVSAVLGLGEALVSGEADADTHRVQLSGAGEVLRVETEVAAKPEALRLLPSGGTARAEVPEALRDAPALTEAEVRALALSVRRVGEALGGPQDVEWAVERGDGGERRLLLLQARPITAIPTEEAWTGERRVWDNSNIVESYAGVTSPLTFSFARGLYEEVYRQFCALVGVPERAIERNRAVFAHLLGLVRGRVYYNLLNWYRVLALLPGFSVNRGFMERMMGVRERLDDAFLAETGGKAEDAARLARTAWRLTREGRRLSTAVPSFHAHVDAVLRPLADEDLAGWDADRLLGLYRRLEEELLRRWQTPIVNDFFAMVWFGTLSRLVERWLPDAPPTLVNDLLTGEGGIVSTEPARRVMELARRVDDFPAVAAAFAHEPDDGALWTALRGDAAAGTFLREVDDYLRRFGDRCMNELKLETVALGEDPAFLLQMIRSYRAGGLPERDPGREAQVRRAAEAVVRESLPAWRRPFFARALRSARARVRDRENLRFERTRVFGAVRRIFLALGHRLRLDGVLADRRDVFLLTVEEVFAHVEGTGTVGDLAALAELRRAEWDGYEREAPPPERFESFGPPSLGRWRVAETARPAPLAEGAALRGIGCCPGVVRAPVRLVRDPREAGDLAGRILVAERTDPGWTLLFPAARGLLVERGSPLSHSAIVAREVGLPCVVSIPGLMATLTDGEVVEMDGRTGEVRRSADG